MKELSIIESWNLPNFFTLLLLLKGLLTTKSGHEFWNERYQTLRYFNAIRCKCSTPNDYLKLNSRCNNLQFHCQGFELLTCKRTSSDGPPLSLLLSVPAMFASFVLFRARRRKSTILQLLSSRAQLTAVSCAHILCLHKFIPV